MPAPVVALVAKQMAGAAKTRARHRVAAWAGGLGLLAACLPMTAIIIAVGGTRDPSVMAASAVADIPPEALLAYRDAGEHWHVDWAILAGIGKLECDHGRADLAGCNPPDTINEVGARGYMQFLGSTWRSGLGQRDLEPRSAPPAPDGQGYATDGDADGDADPWSWPDAASSAARLLAANNVGGDPAAAIWSYNHDDEYVGRVLAYAASYRSAGLGFSSGTLTTVDGITVDAQIAPQVRELLAAAAEAGYSLSGGGWRSADAQVVLRRAHCGESDYATYEMPPSLCSPPTARPGESMHERGLAIDFSCGGLLITDRSSDCYQWLAANAGGYGFIELTSGAEPWHWSTTGT